MSLFSRAHRVLLLCCSFLGDRARLRTVLAAQGSRARSLFFAGGPSCCPLLLLVDKEPTLGIRRKAAGGSRLVLALPHLFHQSMRAGQSRSPMKIEACRRTRRIRGEASVGRHRAPAGVRRTFVYRPENRTPRWGLVQVPSPSRSVCLAGVPFVPLEASLLLKGKPCLDPSFGSRPRLGGRLRRLGLGSFESSMLLRSSL